MRSRTARDASLTNEHGGSGLRNVGIALAVVAVVACSSTAPAHKRGDDPSKAPHSRAEPSLLDEDVVPIPDAATLERQATQRWAALLEIIHVRSPRIAEELRRICVDGTCTTKAVSICQLRGQPGARERECQVRDGGLLVRITQYGDDAEAHVTLWTDRSLVAEVERRFGRGVGNDGRRLFPDIPFAGSALYHHPIAGVIELGAARYVPWHALVRVITSSVGAEPSLDGNLREATDPLLTPLYVAELDLRVALVRGDDGRVAGGSTCLRYTSPAERSLIWSAIRAGVPGGGVTRTYLAHDGFAGYRGVVFPQGIQVVDHVFDTAQDAEQRGAGCWLLGFGQITEDVLFEPLNQFQAPEPSAGGQ